MSSRKDAAIAFLQLASAGQVEEAFGTYVASGFRHHNPSFAGDADSLAKAMKQNADEHPHKMFEVHHVLEEGDLVAAHSRVRLDPDGSDNAVVHLFRFQGEQIVELWDVGQGAPEDSPNDNGMF